MTELSETQIQNKVVCTRCNTDYSNNILEKMCMGKTSICQVCRAELSGKYAGLPPKPFFKATLPMPPSVNHYWGKAVRYKNGKPCVHVYLTAKANKFRSDVIAHVASLGRIRTQTGRIKAHITICGRDKRKFDIDNYQKAVWDALTHAKVIADDELIDELIIKRGEIIKGGKVAIELYEIEAKEV